MSRNLYSITIYSHKVILMVLLSFKYPVCSNISLSFLLMFSLPTLFFSFFPVHFYLILFVESSFSLVDSIIVLLFY